MKRGTHGDIVLEGEVRFAGERIDGLPAHEIRTRAGALPRAPAPFRELTVGENLPPAPFCSKEQGKTRNGGSITASRSSPAWRRKAQIAGTLSGGEQQMLATARALMFEAKLLAIDEPSLGLAPRIREELFAAIGKIHAGGVPVLLVSRKSLRCSAWRSGTTSSRRGASSPRARPSH